MDGQDTAESIVRLLPGLPAEAVESLLVALDALVGVADEGLRPVAAPILRDTGESCRDGVRRARLRRAADALAAGEPCALTPDGLTWKLAAAAQTVTQAEWDERIAKSPLPPPPGESEEPEDDETADAPHMEEEPPKLPHLRVRHFFPGLLVRVGRDFADALGRTVCSGDLLHVLAVENADDHCTVGCPTRKVRLSLGTAGHDAIIENAGNAWFQPVPTTGCLEDLLDEVDGFLIEAEEADSDDDAENEDIEALRADVDACEEWLANSGQRGPAPRCPSGRLAASIFGRDHAMTQLIPLLFAAVAVWVAEP